MLPMLSIAAAPVPRHAVARGHAGQGSSHLRNEVGREELGLELAKGLPGQVLHEGIHVSLNCISFQDGRINAEDAQGTC